MRLEPRLFCGEMEAWRAVYSISIKQCHRRHSQVRAHCDQFLGSRSPFEKAECGAGMKFNVHQLRYQSVAKDFVIPSEARDLQFAAKCRSLPFGYAQGRDDKLNLRMMTVKESNARNAQISASSDSRDF